MRKLALGVVLFGLVDRDPRRPRTSPREFAQPSRAVQPKFRWWWPNALVDNAEIAKRDRPDGRRRLRRRRDRRRAPQLDLAASIPPGHGWGTQAWVDATQTALERAKARGMTIDLTRRPELARRGPEHHARQRRRDQGDGLRPRRPSRRRTFSGPAPQPVVAPATPRATQKKLLYVQAAKVTTAGNPPTTAYTLDRTTLAEPHARRRRQHQLHPARQRQLDHHRLLGARLRPEARGLRPHDARLVRDRPLQPRPARARSPTTGTSTSSRPRSSGLLKDAGGAFFEDSLELETTSALWTPGFVEAFEQQIGYSLLPYLPLAVKHNEKTVFNFDSDTSARVRRDINLVLTNLYNENHIKPLKAWANALGLKLRVQPYGLQTDAMQASALLDIPEGESLGFKNLDDYRRQAGARDLAGNKILSNEAGATANGAYSTTWETELRKLAPEFTAGVNQNIFHGFSYLTTPSARWPGFSAFSPVSNAPATASRGARASRPGSTPRDI